VICYKIEVVGCDIGHQHGERKEGAAGDSVHVQIRTIVDLFLCFHCHFVRIKRLEEGRNLFKSKVNEKSGKIGEKNKKTSMGIDLSYNFLIRNFELWCPLLHLPR